MTVLRCRDDAAPSSVFSLLSIVLCHTVDYVEVDSLVFDYVKYSISSLNFKFYVFFKVIVVCVCVCVLFFERIVTESFQLIFSFQLN